MSSMQESLVTKKNMTHETKANSLFNQASKVNSFELKINLIIPKETLVQRYHLTLRKLWQNKKGILLLVRELKRFYFLVENKPTNRE
jgi:hypothetical protein